MATIVTRTGKGSALTFAEGDANFTNLNNDKLESVEEDTNPKLGGELDLSGNNITDSTGNPTLGGYQYPKAASTSAGGTVSNVDDVRNPNTITLDGADSAGIGYNERIRFTGTDVTAAGLAENTDYYIAASIGNDEFEISNTLNGSPISLTDPGTITDFTWDAPDAGSSGGTANNGDLLVYNGTEFDVSSTISPTLNSYVETIDNLGNTDNPTLDATNGTAKTVTISSGLNLPDFSNPQAGQSITLFVSGTGTATGTANYKFAGGATDLTNDSVVSIFYDGSTYWASISTDFQ